MILLPVRSARFIACLSLAAFVAAAQDAEFVLVQDGEIFPSNAVASVSDIASNAVAAVAAVQAATAASNAAAEVEAMVDDVTTIVNGLEGIGYIRGYLLDFGVSGITPNSNVTATVIRYDNAVSNDAAYTYSDLYTYFSEEPAEFPLARMTSSLRDDPTWDEIESVSVVLTNVTVGGTNYECYRNTIAVTNSMTNAFFRIYADAQQSTTGAYLPVKNGISPGGETPLTGTWTCGTNTYKFVGGIRVQR